MFEAAVDTGIDRAGMLVPKMLLPAHHCSAKDFPTKCLFYKGKSMLELACESNKDLESHACSRNPSCLSLVFLCTARWIENEAAVHRPPITSHQGLTVRPITTPGL